MRTNSDRAPEFAALQESLEIESICAGQLCETFTEMTGIDIPVVPFG